MDLDCLSCRTVFTAPDFLACCRSYNRAANASSWICAHCGDQVDIRVVDDEIQRGYIYGAGTAHFSNEHQLPLPGVRAIEDGDALLVTLAGHEWRIPPRAPGKSPGTPG
ncbi:hypothetical protein J4573_20860 [Actinomadura barringtoniae]|uniref:Uncharacterized protein n=1 Tax=Actinomadura barringtoniae TaxID=1427535 RepID=A0A939PBH0_9ACTN|nr:hypothetical protein [Actinomadura barringtoniae]MBO2449565.1 hypothetical protein [Actinomadura barringtoniae]